MQVAPSGLGDFILALGMAQALADAFPDLPLRYAGPRTALMRLCALSMEEVEHADAGHLVGSYAAQSLKFNAEPQREPTWLDLIDEHNVEVHAALPMRHYLSIEQQVGARLPRDAAPLPCFQAQVEQASPFHVVFVTATSWPERKDFGLENFMAVASALGKAVEADLQITVVAPPGVELEKSSFHGLPVQAAIGIGAAESVDLFASAELVIGNDTGLTHLAALASRPDGTSPQVIGIYGRHSHTKWTTGASHHHAAATPFSQMLNVADGCPVRDGLNDALWDEASSISSISPASIAAFACDVAGWR